MQKGAETLLHIECRLRRVDTTQYIGNILGLILNWKQVRDYREQFAGKVVFTNGVFDILHRGHLDYLTEAREYGDALIVGVNSDVSAASLHKGPGRPLNSETDRAYLLSKLEPVDVVVLFNQPTPLELIEIIHPDIIVKGGDYTIDKVVGRNSVEDSGGRAIIIPLTKGYSTSDLIERIKRLK